MARVVKKPEERKEEIMNTAAELFAEKGYEETSVNMIVEKAGIAKGTFYHYFISKEEILGAILEQHLVEYAEGAKALCRNNHISAFEKMQYLLKGLLLNNQASEHLSRNIEDRKDAKLHSMLEEKFYEKFYPLLLSVLQQGMEEGIFNIHYPDELTEILLIGVRGFMHAHLPFFSDASYKERKIRALEELFNKVLNPTDNVFSFY